MHYLTPYDANDPSCERTDVTLGIYSDSVKPKRITEILGIKPSRSTTKGENLINDRTGRSRTGRLNSWLLCSAEHVKSKDVRDQSGLALGIHPADIVVSVERVGGYAGAG
jgi:hypothetical protein